MVIRDFHGWEKVPNGVTTLISPMEHRTVGYMFSQWALVKDYLRTLWLIQVLMAVALLTIIFWPFLFPLTEEQQESMGTGGGLMCGTFWIGYMVIYSALCLWMFLKRSRSAATTVAVLSWMLPFGIFTLGSSVLYIAMSSIVPLVMTYMVVRLERIAKELWPYVPTIPPIEEQEPPRLRLYR